MIKAVPFIETCGSERFKEFLLQPFTIDMLYPIYNEKSCQTLFEGWRGKNMSNWYKFTNENECILEFYSMDYTIKKDISRLRLGVFQLPLPRTINDFINDMSRFEVELYWTLWIDENFEPKEYLKANEVETYFLNLLNKMGKYNEMI